MSSIIVIFVIAIVFLLIVFTGMYFVADVLVDIFYGAVEINSIIIFVFILFIFLTIFSFVSDIICYHVFRSEIGKKDNFFVRHFDNKLKQLSTLILNNRTISQSIIDENVDFAISTNIYMLQSLPSTMVSLGLLGTFIGLSITIAEIASLMASIGGDIAVEEKITSLFSGLPKAIEGMKVAFFTSLFGLGTSLISSVLLMFYNHAVDGIASELRLDVAGYGLLDNSTNIERELAKTAQVLNKQTSVFSNVVSVVSKALNRQADQSNERLDSIAKQNTQITTSIDKLEVSMASYNNADKLLSQANNNLVTIAKQLEVLNIATDKGFDSLGTLSKSMEHYTGLDNLLTQVNNNLTDVVKHLGVLDVSTNSGFSSMQSDIDSSNEINHKLNNTIASNLATLQNTYDNLLTNSNNDIKSQKVIIDKLEATVDGLAAIENVLATRKPQEANEFDTEIRDINTKIRAIDTYISSIEVKDSSRISLETASQHKGNKKWFNIFSQH